MIPIQGQVGAKRVRLAQISKVDHIAALFSGMYDGIANTTKVGMPLQNAYGR